MYPTHHTTGTVYIYHFENPIGNLANTRAQARHYVGFATDFDARQAQHAAGHGSKLMAAVVAAGVARQVFAWSAPMIVEKLIKRHKKTADFCPACAAARGKAPKALPLAPVFVDAEPLPEAEIGRWDWLEGQITAEWRAARVPAPRDLAAIDDLI